MVNIALSTVVILYMIKEIERLIKSDDIVLPGMAAHAVMSPINRLLERSVPPQHSKAGVLALIAPDKFDVPSMTFIIRAHSHPGDKHGGQIAFPGGKMEDLDAHIMETALREANEEIGVIHQDVNIICPLTELYVDVSNFLISPFLGYLDYEPTYILQESEVDGIITVPVDQLLEMDISYKHMTVRERRLKDIPYYDLDGHTLWGATAMITSEIITLLRGVS